MGSNWRLNNTNTNVDTREKWQCLQHCIWPVFFWSWWKALSSHPQITYQFLIGVYIDWNILFVVVDWTKEYWTTMTMYNAKWPCIWLSRPCDLHINLQCHSILKCKLNKQVFTHPCFISCAVLFLFSACSSKQMGHPLLLTECQWKFLLWSVTWSGKKE